MRIKLLNAALITAFGVYGVFGGCSAALADSLTGSYSTGTGYLSTTGSGSTSGSDISLGTNPGVAGANLGLTGAGYAGNVSAGVMSTYVVSDYPGNGANQSSITYSATITNNGSSAQTYTFNYATGGGALEVAPFNGTTSASQMSAQIGATIQINGTTAWSSTATLLGSNSSGPGVYQGSYSLSTTGAAFASSTATTGTTIGSSSNRLPYEAVTFANYNGALNLGTLGVGQSETLTYTLTADTQTPNNLIYGNYYGGGIAKIGDPFSIQGSGSTFQVSTVPEPETYAMMAAGLLLVGTLTRQRKQKKAS